MTAPIKVSTTVHADKATGPYHPLWNWFGYDEPNYTYSEHGKKLLRELTELSPEPPRIRTHNLLTSGDGLPARLVAGGEIERLEQFGELAQIRGRRPRETFEAGNRCDKDDVLAPSGLWSFQFAKPVRHDAPTRTRSRPTAAMAAHAAGAGAGPHTRPRTAPSMIDEN